MARDHVQECEVGELKIRSVLCVYFTKLVFDGFLIHLLHTLSPYVLFPEAEIVLNARQGSTTL